MAKTVDTYLFRQRRGDQGTEGILCVPDFSFSCYSLELPWRDNQTDISCIPPGAYPLAWEKSKGLFYIQNIPGRNGVRVEPGNFAGDKALGFRSDVKGCVVLGQQRGMLFGQAAVLRSRVTVKRFNHVLKDRNALLTIVEPWEER